MFTSYTVFIDLMKIHYQERCINVTVKNKTKLINVLSRQKAAYVCCDFKYLFNIFWYYKTSILEPPWYLKKQRVVVLK